MIKIITCDCKILLMIKNNYMRLLMIKIITCDCKILLMIKNNYMHFIKDGKRNLLFSMQKIY